MGLPRHCVPRNDIGNSTLFLTIAGGEDGFGDKSGAVFKAAFFKRVFKA